MGKEMTLRVGEHSKSIPSDGSVMVQLLAQERGRDQAKGVDGETRQRG